MLTKHVIALVRRDMAEVIAANVFEHEIEILKDIHGESNVELAKDQPDAAPVELDAGEEMDRLMNCYGASEAGQPYAERIYGRGKNALEAMFPSKKAAKKAKADEAE